MSRCPNPECRRESWQEHVPGCRGMVPPEHATEHAARQLITGLKARVVELELITRNARELLQRAYDDADVYVTSARQLLAGASKHDGKDCGLTFGSVTWCCEKHAAEDGEGLVKQREQAVLDAWKAVADTELLTYAKVPFPGAPSAALREACEAVLALRGLT